MQLLLRIVIIVLVSMQFADITLAEDKISVKGKISGYNLEQKILMVTVAGKDMAFLIQDEKALGMLDDQLYAGDDVKIRYNTKDGHNIIDSARDLRSARPGC